MHQLFALINHSGAKTETFWDTKFSITTVDVLVRHAIGNNDSEYCYNLMLYAWECKTSGV